MNSQLDHISESNQVTNLINDAEYLGQEQLSCPEKITPRRRLKRRLPQAIFYHDYHSIRKKILKIFFYAMEMWKKHSAM